ncbi:UDP-N-acetylglucosamine transferase subunit ALG14 homolog [Xenia sp. Carnegie-2017]|uniref:UDP-N-acetylglucosamine transferase subunit ALG14 homolog n=1 Tax=Xenia sp. Carnegie-2017 TaxID=2897299 RepID=UPI001F04A883|nr:UDP-N-acetylglucosamine transferase subunit ALG14 homolog [Xenia sp. Carnegie-2017]
MLVVYTIFVAFIFCFILRFYWVFIRKKSLKNERVKRNVKTMIVAGSGGHTKEMLTLLSGLSKFYYPRIYIVANSDDMSKEKIQSVEKQECFIENIPRSREVHQPWISTVYTTLKSFWFSFPIVYQHKPDMILCNGPGTCIPICAAALVIKVLGMHHVSIIYIESICRVETLSLSAKILYYFADQILVQWKQLEIKYPRTLYIGKLV